ncbi:Peptidase S28 [Dillenia turbinata]|uniref:Peptidase S28 n=1 Tax=Dillenia turbinata TaxID=194707 RepID=A0AAN8Z6F5_9MAGN
MATRESSLFVKTLFVGILFFGLLLTSGKAVEASEVYDDTPPKTCIGKFTTLPECVQRCNEIDHKYGKQEDFLCYPFRVFRFRLRLRLPCPSRLRLPALIAFVFALVHSPSSSSSCSSLFFFVIFFFIFVFTREAMEAYEVYDNTPPKTCIGKFTTLPECIQRCNEIDHKYGKPEDFLCLLALWFRLKFPRIALGALASSAPILYFDDIMPETKGYYSVVTKDFRVGNRSHCLDLHKPDPRDPKWLVSQGKKEIEIIRGWVRKVLCTTSRIQVLNTVISEIKA